MGLSVEGTATIDRGVWLKIPRIQEIACQKIIHAREGRKLELRVTLHSNNAKRPGKTRANNAALEME